jgi:uncharacterized protein
VYGYLITANIHAAAGFQRVLILNDRIWKNDKLAQKTSKLLKDIEQGINTHGIVQDDNGELMYAYEVNGLGNVLKNFDDANIPSLLSIPLLGWDGYHRDAYENTRKHICRLRIRITLKAVCWWGLVVHMRPMILSGPWHW